MSAAVPAPQPPARKRGKLSASYALTRQSFHLLRQDKEILAFPVLSAVTSLLIIGSLGLLIWPMATMERMESIQNLEGEQAQQMQSVLYGIVFLTYLVNAFVITFFQAGLTAIVHGRLQGKDLSFMDGMRVAAKHVRKIALWALISATAGVALRIIADRGKLAGMIAASFLGAAWTVITLFIVPTLILEEGTVQDAIHRSAETFKKVWGETLLVQFSVGFFLGMIALAALAATLLLLFTQNLTVIIAGGVLLLAFYVALAIVSSSLEAIVRVALYVYAKTGTVPPGFTPELLTGSIKPAA